MVDPDDAPRPVRVLPRFLQAQGRAFRAPAAAASSSPEAPDESPSPLTFALRARRVARCAASPRPLLLLGRRGRARRAAPPSARRRSIRGAGWGLASPRSPPAGRARRRLRRRQGGHRGASARSPRSPSCSAACSIFIGLAEGHRDLRADRVDPDPEPARLTMAALRLPGRRGHAQPGSGSPGVETLVTGAGRSGDALRAGLRTGARWSAVVGGSPQRSAARRARMRSRRATPLVPIVPDLRGRRRRARPAARLRAHSGLEA